MLKRIRKLLGTYKVKSLLILAYRSYGTARHIYVKGRLLDNAAIRIEEKQTMLQTIRNAFRQFDTHEIAGCKVSLFVGGWQLSATTDRKGYFLIDETLPGSVILDPDHEGWVSFTLAVADKETPSATEDIVSGEFLIAEKEADFGIISDIDDTILNTGVTSFLKWKVVRNSLFVNAFSRVPLEGAPDLYRKLHRGVDAKEKNPVFYLSNSPWNMYRYLEHFLDHNGFPKGPILLRSFSSFFQRVAADEKPHKQKEIVNLLETYPELKFILIGDSGEHDASIYTEIAAQFPHRILCIYLRTVNHRRRMQHVRSIVDNFRSTPVILVEKSADAEKHAEVHGFL